MQQMTQLGQLGPAPAAIPFPGARSRPPGSRPSVSRPTATPRRPHPPSMPPPLASMDAEDLRAEQEQEQEVAEEMMSAILDMHSGQNVLSYELLEAPDTNAEPQFLCRPMLLYLSFGTAATGPHKHGPILRWFYTDRGHLAENPADFIILKHITEIYTGKLTELLLSPATKDSDPWHCLTIITPDRALNLDMGSQEFVDTWVVGLQQLLIPKGLMIELFSNQVPDVYLIRGSLTVEPVESPDEASCRMFRVCRIKHRAGVHGRYVAPTALALMAQGHSFQAYGFLHDPVTAKNPTQTVGLFCFYSAKRPKDPPRALEVDRSRGAAGARPADEEHKSDGMSPPTAISTSLTSSPEQQHQPLSEEEPEEEGQEVGGYLFWNMLPPRGAGPQQPRARRRMSTARMLAVRDIVSVFVGCHTSGFHQYRRVATNPECCLSIVAREPEEAGGMLYLDLEAQTPEVRNAWIQGLYVLLQEAGCQLRPEVQRRPLHSLRPAAAAAMAMATSAAMADLARQESQVHRSSLNQSAAGGGGGGGSLLGSLREESLISSNLGYRGHPVAGVSEHRIASTGNSVKYYPGSMQRFFQNSRWASLDTDNDGLVGFELRRDGGIEDLNLLSMPHAFREDKPGGARRRILPPPPDMTAFHVLLAPQAIGGGGPGGEFRQEFSAQGAGHARAKTALSGLSSPGSAEPSVSSTADGTVGAAAGRPRLRFLSDRGELRGAFELLGILPELDGSSPSGHAAAVVSAAAGPQGIARNTRYLQTMLSRGQVFELVVSWKSNQPELQAAAAVASGAPAEEDDREARPRCVYLAENTEHLCWLPPKHACVPVGQRPPADGRVRIRRLVPGKQDPSFPKWEFEEYVEDQCATLIADDRSLHVASASAEVIQSFVWALGLVLKLPQQQKQQPQPTAAIVAPVPVASTVPLAVVP